MKKILSLFLAIALLLPCFNMINVTAEGETGSIEGATLNLGSTLSLDYYATFTAPADKVSMRFTTSSGRVTTVDGVYNDVRKMYKFTYTGINPQCMTDNVKAELLYNKNVLAQKDTYSVKNYCDNQFSSSENKKNLNSVQYKALRTLLADMLVYGEEAQKYMTYNIDALAGVSSWVDLYKSEFSLPTGIKTVTGNEDDNNKVISVGLTMANVNKIYYKLYVTDDVTVKINGTAVDKSTFKDNQDGTYTVHTEGIYATDFDKVYTLELIKNNTVISKVSYNVYAYIERMCHDAVVGDIVKALYNYGRSAKAYLKAMEGYDSDFDLSEEDMLEAVVNLVEDVNSKFDEATKVSDTRWDKIGTVSLSISDDGYTGKCLRGTKGTGENSTYYSPMIDISPYVKTEAIYEVSMKVKVSGASEAEDEITLSGVIRTDSATSFNPTPSNGNYYNGFDRLEGLKNDTWYEYKFQLPVEESDIGAGGKWRVGFHNVQAQITDIYIDDFAISKIEYKDFVKPVTSAETWVANELVIVSDFTYEDPYNDVELNLTLTDGNVTYTVPGFWDGGRIWRVRFVCPTEGTWRYTTSANVEGDHGLHGVTNTFECTKYSGDLDIYKHGFVTTSYDKKYFTYADGTPFFYLGDTHWGLGRETLDMVKTVAEKRAEQGYTVYQSEPLDAKYNLTNGLGATDIPGFKDLDEKFKTIAENGLVHANAEFFFSSEMQKFIENNGGYSKTVLQTVTHNSNVNAETGTKQHPIYDLSDEAKAALEKLSRYWVARYSAYPVMWTLAQEIDNDFFWQSSDSKNHIQWCYVNNPYRYVAQYIGKHDPYKSPLSGHMEHSGFNANQTVANSGNPMTSSAFNDIKEHNWFAAQWKSAYDGKETSNIAKIAENFWNSSKISINYEGKYWYLATKDYGARAQAWGSLLSGMFGHGWGGQDTWYYLSTYDESVTSYYGTSSSYLDAITPEEKQAKTWEDALYSDSSLEMVTMKNFFENTVGEWWNLVPRFENTAYLTRESAKINTSINKSETVNAYAVVASNTDNSKIVAYFYNYTDTSVAQNANTKVLKNWLGTSSADGGTLTGTFGNLVSGATYEYIWFNPRTGEASAPTSFTTTSTTWKAPAKANCDMVLYIYKK